MFPQHYWIEDNNFGCNVTFEFFANHNQQVHSSWKKLYNNFIDFHYKRM